MRSMRANTRIRNEIVIQRSRFITSLGHTPSEYAARQFITSVRKEFPDATHNCSAFVIKPAEANEIGHSNDDGEPSGTAGMPMLEVLRRNNVVNITAVVTRYFGGTLLGAGGLVRAYSTSVSEALEKIPLVRLERWQRWRVELPHAGAGRFQAQLHTHGGVADDISYTDTVTLHYLCPARRAQPLSDLIAELSAGTTIPSLVGEVTVEIDETTGRPL